MSEDLQIPSPDWIKSNFNTKSGAIRYLHGKGYDVLTISKHLDIRYQHVRNVINQDLKRGPNESYIDSEWGCSHNKAEYFIDVILRRGWRDPNSSRVMYRVCLDCAKDLIPGVTEENVKRYLPGAKR